MIFKGLLLFLVFGLMVVVDLPQLLKADKKKKTLIAYLFLITVGLFLGLWQILELDVASLSVIGKMIQIVLGILIC